MAGETAIRHPKRGKAHRPTRWVTEGMGLPWEHERVVGTACGYGDGRTLRAMTENVPLEQTAPEDRCKTCWKGDAS